VRVKRCYMKCALRLAACEVKRIPVKNLLILSGYYVGCPACGRSMTVSTTRAPIVEEGLDPGETPLLSLGPVPCESCGVVFKILRDEVSLV
jgi:hypothetical protein